MLGILYHRHFTHAWAFAPVGGLAAAGIFYGLARLLKKDIPFLPVYLVCVLAFMSHGFLDALTNYGTHIFWPFSAARESWNIISIIDPVFTLTALTLLLIGLRRGKRVFLRAGLIFMLAYWSLGLWQREALTDKIHEIAAARGHQIERLEVKPSFGNIIVWRTQYVYKGRIYADAIHRSPWAGTVVYEGASAPLTTVEDKRFRKLSEMQRQDLAGFAFFADGWLTPLPDGVVADARFSALPHQLKPLWGLRFGGDGHAVRVRPNPRGMDDAAVLWDMVKGKKLS